MLHIVTKSVPVGAANSISIVERYQSLLRRSFSIIKKEASDVHNDYALQLAVKAMNDIIGSNILVPSLLVFGALPGLVLPTDLPMPSTFKRAVELQYERESMSRHFVKQQFCDDTSARKGSVVT